VSQVAIALAALGWCTSGGLTAAEMVHKAAAHQMGVFSTAEWRHADIIRYLRQHRLEGRVYSNYPEALYYLTGIVAEQTPHRGPMRVASETFPRDLQQFVQVVHEDRRKDQPVWIVWFSNQSRSHFMYGMEEIINLIPMTLYRRFRSGTVWHLAISP